MTIHPCPLGHEAVLVKPSRVSDGPYVKCAHQGGCFRGPRTYTDYAAIAAWNLMVDGFKLLPNSEKAAAAIRSDQMGNPESRPVHRVSDAEYDRKAIAKAERIAQKAFDTGRRSG